MKKNIGCIIASVIIIISSSLLQAQQENPAEKKQKPLQQLLDSALTPTKKDETLQSNWEIPDWFKRVSYGIYIETDRKPRIYLETVQPLYQTEDKIHTFFTHDRISIQDERGTYSLGLGYRRLLFEENLLAGINTFFDYRDLHKHYRQGVGIEVIGKQLEFRANSYFRLSPKRLVEETDFSRTYEQVANGFDTEIGGPLPYLPWFKLFGSFYHYNYRKSSDMNGWQLRGEIKPFKFITLNLKTFDDNKGEQEYIADVRFSLAFSDFRLKSILSAFNLSKEAYPETDLKEHTLDRVERNFKIVLEKWTETKTGEVSVIIGRAD
ncbi:MAG: inverse autotransporter beta domain-containing protein [Candidatus Omnitrophica bacterium]|nr:inverse autotransporter beta domain-containing protein [Candidatus Omnitrophota bacterium]